MCCLLMGAHLICNLSQDMRVYVCMSARIGVRLCAKSNRQDERETCGNLQLSHKYK